MVDLNTVRLILHILTLTMVETLVQLKPKSKLEVNGVMTDTKGETVVKKTLIYFSTF